MITGETTKMSYKNKFRYMSLTSVGVAALFTASPALSQSVDNSDAIAVNQQANEDGEHYMDTIIVEGVRGSLARAVDLKRNSTTVQDSVSALELGLFPDDNVADSLSHVTGVAISRSAGGEGRSVSVRGLGPEYTLTTFNGRILATDGAGRDFAYDVLPSDVISGADVIKGSQASLTEGAIGGLINLKSANPLDNPGQHGSIRIQGDRNLMSELDGMKFSGVYSNTFAQNTVGVMLGVVLEQRDDRSDIAGNDGGWSRNADPNDESWLWGNTWGGAIDPNNNGILDEEEYGLIGPGQFRVGSILEEKKRNAFSGKLEWNPTDNFSLIVDGLKTQLDSPEVGYQQSFYTLYAPGRWSNMNIENGIVTSFDMDSDDTELQLNPELLNQTSYRVVDTDLYGINAQWDATDSLSFEGDIYRSTSKRHSGGQDTYVVLRMNQPNSASVSLSGAEVPSVMVNFDDGRTLAAGLASGAFTASDFNTHYMSLSGDNIDDEVLGAKFSGEWSLENSFLESVTFGLSRTEREKSRDLVNNSLSGGADYYSGTNAINVGNLNGNVISGGLSLPNFMEKISSSFPRTFLSFDVPNYLQQLEAYDGNLRADDSPYSYAAAAPEWNPLQSYRVSEKTTALFAQANFATDRFSGNVGLRYVNTETNAQGWDSQILSITANGPWNYTAEYAAPTTVTQDNDESYILPSANLNWNLTEELILRLGAARTMARPSVETLAPTNTTEGISWGEFTQVYGGNAELKPYTADQFDASLEWYFAENSIVNFATFFKKIENQITTSWEPGQDIGVPGYLFNIVRPINGDYAEVFGIEAGLHHLWENGFGIRAQYTYNDAKSFVGELERPLEGIAPSVYSLGGFYEKGPLSMGITGDHTEGFVTAINVLGEGYDEEADPITWLTAHASYRISDQFSVSIEGQNLLDAENTYTINGNPLLSQGYYRYGRSIKVGGTYRF